jgi:hypothetical protein
MTKTQLVKTDSSRGIKAFFGSEASFAASLSEVIVANPPLFMVGVVTRLASPSSTPTSHVKHTSINEHQIQAFRQSSTKSPVKMSKPGALLIGGLTHAKKEWEDCASFADLKVCISETETSSADAFE